MPNKKPVKLEKLNPNDKCCFGRIHDGEMKVVELLVVDINFIEIPIGFVLVVCLTNEDKMDGFLEGTVYCIDGNMLVYLQTK